MVTASRVFNENGKCKVRSDITECDVADCTKCNIAFAYGFYMAMDDFKEVLIDIEEIMKQQINSSKGTKSTSPRESKKTVGPREQYLSFMNIVKLFDDEVFTEEDLVAACVHNGLAVTEEEVGALLAEARELHQIFMPRKGQYRIV